MLRQYAWFPNIDKAAKEEIDTCLPCQVNGPSNPPELLLAPEMPDGPWQFIHADFYESLPTGQYIIVLIDKYSRYPEADIMNSTSVKHLFPNEMLFLHDTEFSARLNQIMDHLSMVMNLKLI